MIFVTKFRANDLNPSKGKQIEFNKGVIESFSVSVNRRRMQYSNAVLLLHRR